jgi:hypothetical protein|eukprot:COSAG02_NODE_109_length_36250_cov_121.168903_21_plen_92_part_00
MIAWAVGGGAPGSKRVLSHMLQLLPWVQGVKITSTGRTVVSQHSIVYSVQQTCNTRNVGMLVEQTPHSIPAPGTILREIREDWAVSNGILP